MIPLFEAIQMGSQQQNLVTYCYHYITILQLCYAKREKKKETEIKHLIYQNIATIHAMLVRF